MTNVLSIWGCSETKIRVKKIKTCLSHQLNRLCTNISINGISFDPASKGIAMEYQKSLARKEKLNTITAAYAEIWADVLLDKNLELHLSQVTEDLRYLHHLIKSKDMAHPQIISYYRIANELIRLKYILDEKLKKPSLPHL